jgi:hypothetical protein
MAEKNWGARWDVPQGDAPRWDENRVVVRQQVLPDDTVRCPCCKSTQLYPSKRGFKFGFWMLFFSPLALLAAFFFLLPGLIVLVLAGFIGANKIVLTCLQCGNKSRPGSANDWVGWALSLAILGLLVWLLK